MARTSYLECSHVLDGRGDELWDVVIEVQEDHIFRIHDGGDIEATKVENSSRWIDLTDYTVMPGLIDAHLHLKGSRDPGPTEQIMLSRDRRLLRAALDAEKLVKSGFTTVRCMGSTLSFAIRDAVAEGELTGPRILAAGQSISQTGGHGDIHYLPLEWVREHEFAIIADGVPECLAAVRKQLRDTADVIKIHATGGCGSQRDKPRHRQYTVEELRAIVDEAHAWGRRVGAHAQGKEGIVNAIRAGVDTIEHGFWLDEEVCDLMLREGIFYVPTLMAIQRNVDLGPDYGATKWRIEKSREALAAHRKSFQLALSRGVAIAVGSDNLGPELRPHGTSAEELELMVELGMTPMQAIQAATSTAAEALGCGDEIGAIDEGLAADIIAVAGNPVEDIRALRSVEFVMFSGNLIVDEDKSV